MFLYVELAVSFAHECNLKRRKNMTHNRLLYILVSNILSLVVQQTSVHANRDSLLNSNHINCTSDVDCPSNWKCLKDPQIDCSNRIWPDGAVPYCFRSMDVIPPLCVAVPDISVNVELSNQSLSLDRTTVELDVSWSGTNLYPFNVIIAIDLLRYSVGETSVSRIVHNGLNDEPSSKPTERLTLLAGNSNYSLFLTVVSAAGSSPVYGPLNFTTIVSAPAALQNLQVKQDPKEHKALTLTFKCPDRFYFGGELSAYVIRTSQINQTEYGPCLYQYHKSDCLNITSSFQVGSVKVGNEYIVKDSETYYPIRDDTCRDSIFNYRFLETGVEAGKTYVIQVKLQNEEYEGPMSNPAILTPNDNIVPDPDNDNTDNKKSLIIGLSVGLGGTLILIVFGLILYKQLSKQRVKT